MSTLTLHLQISHKKTIDDITDDEIAYGPLYFEFSDGIREADGLRILRCWRYLLFFFRGLKI